MPVTIIRKRKTLKLAKPTKPEPEAPKQSLTVLPEQLTDIEGFKAAREWLNREFEVIKEGKPLKIGVRDEVYDHYIYCYAAEDKPFDTASLSRAMQAHFYSKSYIYNMIEKKAYRYALDGTKLERVKGFEKAVYYQRAKGGEKKADRVKCLSLLQLAVDIMKADGLEVSKNQLCKQSRMPIQAVKAHWDDLTK